MSKLYMEIKLCANPFGEYNFIEDKYTDDEVLDIIVKNARRMRGVISAEKTTKRHRPYKETDEVIIYCTAEARDRIAKKFNLLEMPRLIKRKYIVFNGSFHVTDEMLEALEK